ncbi:MAG: DNA replication and repair protein RecF [Candidatus Saccharimonadales bacterium]
MIAGIHLQGYRSYEDASFEFGAGVNIIVGPNASGKTNLLESVLVVSRGGSYRVRDSELIRHETPWARIDMQGFDGEKRVVKLQPHPNGVVQKVFEIDEKKLVRLHPSRQLPVVLFEPDHLQLLTGSPDARRGFLDDLIEQLDPEYVSIRKQYKRTLSQRNNLLKKNPQSVQQQLFVWNVRLSQLGGRIARSRRELLDNVNISIGDIYTTIADKLHDIRLEYVSKFKPETYESSLFRALESNTETEVMRGYTLYGPHREDFTVMLNDSPAEHTASRGEIRTLLLALKVLELRILEDARGQKPLLLLDDVFSELDGKRRQALTGFVRDYQTFITTTDADLVVQHFTDKARIIPVTS